jgi:MFS family permease
VLSNRLPGGGPELFGLLLGVWAAGEVAGSLLAGSIALRVSLGTAISVSQILSGLGLGVLLFGQSRWLALPALALLGFFSAPLTIWAQTLRMEIIPPEMRGRTFALLRTLMQSTPPVGGAVAGLLLPILGLPAMIGISTLLVGVPGLLGYGLTELRAAGRPAETREDPVQSEFDYMVSE